MLNRQSTYTSVVAEEGLVHFFWLSDDYDDHDYDHFHDEMNSRSALPNEMTTTKVDT